MAAVHDSAREPCRDAMTMQAADPTSPSAETNTDLLLELESQLRKSSFFMQASLEQHGKLATKLDLFLTSLIDVLVRTGAVDQDELLEAVTENRQQPDPRQSDDDQGDVALPPWPTVLVRDDGDDAPAEPVAVNCAERMHICKAVCCSLPFPLSATEVEAGRVKWDLGHPYLIRHTEAGFCVHNDRRSGRCGVYDDRPQVCHAYSCATDERIWKDFDNMELNEEFLDGRRPQQFRFKPATADAVPVRVIPRHERRRDDQSAPLSAPLAVRS
jgi:Fe-S-cluster containining protein